MAKNKNKVVSEPATKKGNKEPTPDDIKKPSRGLVVGDNFGWTGKLPVTLLNEHCQKQKWNKCQYDMMRRPNGYIGIVTLSWENPKTKELLSVKYTPTYSPRGTSNEARHMVATFVLHRINYVKNMKMLLPVIFRDYWSDLEKERLQILKEDKKLHDIRYNVNPFAVVMEQQKIKAEKEKDRAARDNQNLKMHKPVINIGQKPVPSMAPTTKSSIPRGAWEHAPLMDIPSDMRVEIEKSVQRHLEWDGLEKTRKVDESIAKKLAGLGFRESHVREALQYTSEFTDALEWLIFHIPEDDLPALFAKSRKDSEVQLTISQNLKTELALKRLKNLGFDEDEILRVYQATGEDEVETSVQLTKLLAKEENEVATEEQSQEIWGQEVEAINSTRDATNSDEKSVTIPLNPIGVGEGAIELKLFKSTNYPNEIPGIQLLVAEKYNLANYVKLSIVRNLLSTLHVGECMIFSIIEWLEENMINIINNPGPLVMYQKELNTATQPSASNGDSKGRKKVRQNENDIKLSYQNRAAALQDSISERAKLPVWNKAQDLVKVINDNAITLITGETGSGKSTQIVQYILDDLNSRGDFSTTIFCTQPRRISALGLAARITEERGDIVGQEVGYMIRGENKISPATRITFLTTGILLRMLQNITKEEDHALFDNLGYIFIDEVHERSVDSDFLLIILRDVLKKFKKLRVVLMSATIKIDKFNEFFKKPLVHEHVKGRTFPIEDFYLDDILNVLDYSMEVGGELIKPRADSAFFKCGNINYELIAQLVGYIDKKLASEGDSGSILIFMPGVPEINRTIKAISNVSNFWTLPLHSQLSSQEQKKVFQSSRGQRKVVVSTNIAETSITIPDCVAVIDSGRSKSMFYDTSLNATKLVEEWCSQAEIKQRRGRSGRVAAGCCYHMYTKDTEDSMLAQPIPEILRVRLENLYLIVKSMGVKNVENFIASGLDAPDQSALLSAKNFLQDVGALEGDNLTTLGQYLSYLPTDAHTGKLLLLGCIFGCLDFCSILAAISSVGSIFAHSMENRDKIKSITEKYSDKQGDFIAMANIYRAYLDSTGKKFITENCLSYTALRDISSTRQQYYQLLSEIGFTTSSNVPKTVSKPNYYIIRAIIVGSFYPNVARVQYPPKKFLKSSSGAIEADADARLTKYWVKKDNPSSHDSPLAATRVFIHPSSILFGKNTTGFEIDEELESQITREDGSVDIDKARQMVPLNKPLPASKHTFIAYRSSHFSSKLYVNGVTPSSTLATLLFGGSYEYYLHQTSGNPSNGIILDKWLPVRTWCKNGVLIKQVRKLLDRYMDSRLSKTGKFENSDDIVAIIEKVVSL
ncbi:ucp12 [Candida margitis]|uniref:ucp12 n=1 Tax=Candida margitis TaxID=1775924 RepID=UPI002225D914|nr:ucp12 [Candida margitis]KAI5968134.1 ucp12 [Candida margitis]